jgi:hypothetical protein
MAVRPKATIATPTKIAPMSGTQAGGIRPTNRPPTAGPTTKEATSTVTSALVARSVAAPARRGIPAAKAGYAGVPATIAPVAATTATSGFEAARAAAATSRATARAQREIRTMRARSRRSARRPDSQLRATYGASLAAPARPSSNWDDVDCSTASNSTGQGSPMPTAAKACEVMTRRTSGRRSAGSTAIWAPAGVGDFPTKTLDPGR